MHWRLKAQVGQAFGQLEENIDGTEVCLTSAAKTMKTSFGETLDRYLSKISLLNERIFMKIKQRGKRNEMKERKRRKEWKRREEKCSAWV